MVKKLFALASVTALSGLVVAVSAAGCTTTTTEEDPVVEAGATETGTVTPKDAGKKDVEVDDTPACPPADEIDATKLPWKSPTKQPGACTQADLDALVAFVSTDTSGDTSKWKTSITDAECKACVFAVDGATWAPLIENAKGQLAMLNVGGCFAIHSGNDACGKAYQNWFDCGFEACGECAGDDSAALNKCRQNANKTACKTAFEDVATVCGDDEVVDAETACDGVKYVFEGPIKAQCIGFGDGGDL